MSLTTSSRYRHRLPLLALVAAPLLIACSQQIEIPASAGDGGSGSGADAGSPGADGGASADAATADAGMTGNDGAMPDAGPPTPVVHHLPGVAVTTFVGSGVAGGQDGNGASAQLSNPVDVIFDAQGNLLVTEWDGNRVRKVTPAGDVTTVTSAAVLHGPFALTMKSGGGLIVQTDYDQNNVENDTSGTLWNIDPTGAATMLLGGLGRPRGLASLSNGSVVVVDRFRHTVQILDPSNAQMTVLAGANGSPGFADGVGSVARFNMPYGAAVFPDGSILVADWMNYRLRKVAVDGTVSTYAGNGIQGMVDGPRLSASLGEVRTVAIDGAGVVYFTDVGNHYIRRVNASGDVETVAGDGTAGFQDGTGETARFYGQEGVTVTSDGKTVMVADGSGGDPNVPYHRVRAIAVP